MSITAEQEQALQDKLAGMGYPSHEVKVGEDETPLLYISGRLVCGVEYALALSESALGNLIAETLTYWEALVPKQAEAEEEVS